MGCERECVYVCVCKCESEGDNERGRMKASNAFNRMKSKKNMLFTTFRSALNVHNAPFFFFAESNSCEKRQSQQAIALSLPKLCGKYKIPVQKDSCCRILKVRTHKTRYSNDCRNNGSVALTFGIPFTSNLMRLLSSCFLDFSQRMKKNKK